MLDKSPEAILIQQQLRQSIFYKSFLITGLGGWYLEFGSFRGRTFNEAYHSARQLYSELASNFFGGAQGKHTDMAARQRNLTAQWMGMRFVAFDSFEGIPEPKNAVDKHYQVFNEGEYSCSEADFRRNMESTGVNPAQTIVVPGFFEKTLTPSTAHQIGVKEISVVHIDSDLYESAVRALEFCTPYLVDGSIIIFDEWYQFRGNPFLGEQLAFREWREHNPEWYASEHQQAGAFTKGLSINK